MCQVASRLTSVSMLISLEPISGRTDIGGGKSSRDHQCVNVNETLADIRVGAGEN